MVQKCSILPEEYISNLYKCYQKCLTFQSHTIWFSLTVASHTPWGGGPSFRLEKRILDSDPSLDRKLNVPFARLFEKGESNSSNLSKCSTVNHSSAFAPSPSLATALARMRGEPLGGSPPGVSGLAHVGTALSATCQEGTSRISQEFTRKPKPSLGQTTAPGPPGD